MGVTWGAKSAAKNDDVNAGDSSLGSMRNRFLVVELVYDRILALARLAGTKNDDRH